MTDLRAWKLFLKLFYGKMSMTLIFFFFFIILLIIIPTHQIVLGVLGVGGLKSISYLTVRDFTS